MLTNTKHELNEFFSTGKDIDLTKMSTTLEFDMSAEYFGKVAENFLLRQGAVFSVANNHAGDQGLDGLRTTVVKKKKKKKLCLIFLS